MLYRVDLSLTKRYISQFCDIIFLLGKLSENTHTHIYIYSIVKKSIL